MSVIVTLHSANGFERARGDRRSEGGAGRASVVSQGQAVRGRGRVASGVTKMKLFRFIKEGVQSISKSELLRLQIAT